MMLHSCETFEQYKNRQLAMCVGWACTILATIVIGSQWWSAHKADQRTAAKLASQSERQEAEQAIADTLGFGRAIVNDRGEIVEWNSALQKWTGWDGVGKSLIDVIPEDMREKHRMAFDAAIARVKKAQAEGKKNLAKPAMVSCKLPKMDDPSKTIDVIILVSVVQPRAKGSTPYVVAYIYRANSLEKLQTRL